MTTADRWAAIARRLVSALVAFNALMLLLAVAGVGLTAQFVSQYGGSASNRLFVAGLVVQLAFGALIAIKRPRHPVGWLLLASVTAFLLDQGLMTNYVIYAIHVRGRAIPGGDLVGSVEQMMWVPGIAPIAIFLPLLFPTGKLLSRRWLPIAWIAVVASISAFVANSFTPNADANNLIAGVRQVTLPPPLSSIADVVGGAIFLLPICVLAGVLSLVLRYRRGSGDERHQIKWLLFAISVYLFGFVTSLIPTMLGHTIPLLQDVAVLGLALIPVAAAVAVLKYRLYDIDVVISRALVYASLAVFITAVYVGIVVGIGTLVGRGGQPNLALSIVATAVVAVAFQPVRERVQKVANRLVYGRRSTPYEILSRFAQHVAESYSGEEVLPRMARVLAEGTGAEKAHVWVRRSGALHPAAVWPDGRGDDITGRAVYEPVPVHGRELPALPGDSTVAVIHQGELLGALAVTKRPGESLTPIEQKLLDALAHQAGLVLKNVGLTAELLQRLDDLRASRQRLVAAQDQERRKLERNLHDGAQQNLVALKVKLGLAESLADKNPDRARELIGQLKGDADEALETLRDLARGIYPPLLADRGLLAALESQARKAAIPVEVVASGVARHSQDIEAAVYFCCLEALQNVAKYARATTATIRLSVDGSRLKFDVEDDGDGFDPGTVGKGSGLQNMEDRLDALGGSITVVSTPGDGTRVSGQLPVEVEERQAAALGAA